MPDNSYPPQGGQGFPQDNRDGTPGLIGKDEYTKWEATNRINKVRTDVLAGNFADLQRLGAEAAVNNAVAGVSTHPTVDPKSDMVITPAQQEANRGEWTIETQRTGLLGPPPVNTNPGSGESVPVVSDPTSQSPVAESAPSTPTAPPPPKKS